jgi:hypothetical protein
MTTRIELRAEENPFRPTLRDDHSRSNKICRLLKSSVPSLLQNL